MADLALWLSIGLILTGLLLLLLEVMNPGFFIAVPGTIMVGIGLMGLIAGDLLFGPWAAIMIPVIGIPATVATIWFYRTVAPPGSKPFTMASDSLPGEVGVVERPIAPGAPGRVRVRGTVWRATAAEALEPGTPVVVAAVDGLTLTVERQAPPFEAPPEP